MNELNLWSSIDINISLLHLFVNVRFFYYYRLNVFIVFIYFANVKFTIYLDRGLQLIGFSKEKLNFLFFFLFLTFSFHFT